MTATLLPVSDADVAAFRQRDDTALIERLRQGLYVGIVVGLVLVPTTWGVYAGRISQWLLLLPLAGSAAMAAVVLATRLPGIARAATALCCATSYTLGVIGALIATETGGFVSPYFFVHVMIYTFATALLPLSPWTLLVACAPNLLITPALIVWITDKSDHMLLPMLLSACGLIYAYYGVVLRSQADLQSFVAHTRLAETRASLAALNGELERRVEAQVGEIVRRADDINALNAQLREKVQARSRELAQALRALNQGSEGGALDVGAVLGERVVLGGVLGAGGMGTVYVGRDLVSDRRVAVKVMSNRVLVGPRAIQRFLAEAEATAAVAHPGIVKTLHVDVTAEGLPFLIMEYVDGAPLHLLARRAGRLAPGLVARLGSDIARALAAAHAVGVVHRDVKPSNVMIAREAPAVRLLDFGVSMMERSEEEAASDAVGLTPTGALVGTPAYMAPEQLLGASAATPACDVYSLGIVLYELAAGRHPFAAREGMGLLVAHATEMVPALDAVDPGIPAGLARLVAGAIAKDPVERPGAAALADALARLADGAPDVRALFDGVPDPDSVEATDVSPAT